MERFAPLVNVLDKLDVFLGRQPVRLQLLTLAVCVALAFLISSRCWLTNWRSRLANGIA